MDTDLQNQLKQLQNGCLESRRTIIDQTCERLRCITRRMLRAFPIVRRWTETDDILQEALLRLFHSLHVVKPESVQKYYGFASLQIQRELLQLLRKYSGPYGIETNHDSRGNEFIESQISDPDEPKRLEQWSSFHEAVEQLPEAEQEVLCLMFYGGLDQGSAAKVQGISLATLKRRFQSARLLLRKMHDGKFFN